MYEYPRITELGENRITEGGNYVATLEHRFAPIVTDPHVYGKRFDIRPLSGFGIKLIMDWNVFPPAVIGGGRIEACGSVPLYARTNPRIDYNIMEVQAALFFVQEDVGYNRNLFYNESFMYMLKLDGDFECSFNRVGASYFIRPRADLNLRFIEQPYDKEYAWNNLPVLNGFIHINQAAMYFPHVTTHMGEISFIDEGLNDSHMFQTLGEITPIPPRTISGIMVFPRVFDVLDEYDDAYVSFGTVNLSGWVDENNWDIKRESWYFFRDWGCP